MRRAAVLLVLLPLFGGVAKAAGPSAQQAAEINAVDQANQALLRAHRITHVEAAKRLNAATERVAQGQLSDRDRLMMSYRLALASQIDAGQITTETAKYLWQQRIAENEAQENAARAASRAAVGSAIGNAFQGAADGFAAARTANRGVDCTSYRSGDQINTHCQ